MRRLVAAAVSTPLVLLSATSATADAVTDWNLKTVNAIRTAGLGPNPASRVLAITHIAIHDALAAVSHAYQPYKSNLAVQGPVRAKPQRPRPRIGYSRPCSPRRRPRSILRSRRRSRPSPMVPRR